MSFLPLSEISPYARKGWTIKARVSGRQQLRTFSKGGRSGQLFNIDLLDSYGTEIRATIWNEACDKYDKVLQQGKVFTFTGGYAKVANKKFSGTAHNYELSFDKEATIAAAEEDAAIAQAKLGSIVTLRQLAVLDVPATVNVCVVVTEALGERREVQVKKDGSPQKGATKVLRNMVVADASECSLQLTLWNDAAELEAKLAPGTVVAIKALKVTDFAGRSGSVFDASGLLFDLDIPEAAACKQWWAAAPAALRNLSNGERKAADGASKAGSLAEFEAEASLLQDGQALYWETRAYLSYLRTQKQGEPTPLWYLACSCGKKLAGEECGRCNKRVPQPELRYLLTSLLLEDTDATKWVSAFDNGGQALLGVTAAELSKLGGAGDARAQCAKIEQVVRGRCFNEEFKLRLRAKAEVYEGVLKPRCQVMSARPACDDKADLLEDCQRKVAELSGLFAGAAPDAQAEVRALLQDLQGPQLAALRVEAVELGGLQALCA